MKILFGALALAFAVTAAAQTTPGTDPHAGHAQHQQHGTAGQHGGVAMGHDHAKMMEECQKVALAGKCNEHCEAMMKQHAAASAAVQAESHEGHAH